VDTIFLAADVRCSFDVQYMVHAVVEVSVRIDVLVNNAGVAGYPSRGMHEEDWDRVVVTDLKSVFPLL